MIGSVVGGHQIHRGNRKILKIKYLIFKYGLKIKNRSQTVHLLDYLGAKMTFCELPSVSSFLLLTIRLKSTSNLYDQGPYEGRVSAGVEHTLTQNYGV